MSYTRRIDAGSELCGASVGISVWDWLYVTDVVSYTSIRARSEEHIEISRWEL